MAKKLNELSLFDIVPSSIKNDEEVINIIKSIVWCASVWFIFGIIESLTSVRLFDELFTMSRGLNNIHAYRLGFLRSVTSMGFANIYGNMCLLIFPLILYLLKLTQKRIYLICLFLDFLAIIHSGCRSDLIWFFLLSVMYLLLIFFTHKEDFRRMLTYFITLMVAIILWTAVAIQINDRLNYYYVGTAKSVLNVVGFSFDLDADAPEGIKGYGSNPDGVLSRTSQLSGIQYTLSKNPVFGLGNGFQNRGDIKYYHMGWWKAIHSVDLGIVEIIGAEGLLGLVAFLFIFGGYLIILLQRTKMNIFPLDSITSYLLPFTYLLCTLSSANMMTFLLLLTALLFYDLKTVF